MFSFVFGGNRGCGKRRYNNYRVTREIIKAILCFALGILFAKKNISIFSGGGRRVGMGGIVGILRGDLSRNTGLCPIWQDFVFGSENG